MKRRLQIAFLVFAACLLLLVSYRLYHLYSSPTLSASLPDILVKPEPPAPPPITKPMEKITYILIEKAKRLMTVYHHGEVLRTYGIALGFSPLGHKEKEGDGKTPEGKYRVNGKNPHSQFHLSLQISYPSKADKIAARKKGVNPGSAIMIHGLQKGLGWIGAQHRRKDWTLGCVAVTNEEIEELYPFVEIGTLVEIKP